MQPMVAGCRPRPGPEIRLAAQNARLGTASASIARLTGRDSPMSSGGVADLAVPVAGFVLASRRPANCVGWLFLVAGLGWGWVGSRTLAGGMPWSRPGHCRRPRGIGLPPGVVPVRGCVPDTDDVRCARRHMVLSRRRGVCALPPQVRRDSEGRDL